jgi:hypothetical protein
MNIGGNSYSKVFRVEYDYKVENELYIDYSERTRHLDNVIPPKSLFLECLKFLKAGKGQSKFKLTDFIHLCYFPIGEDSIVCNAKLKKILSEHNIQPYWQGWQSPISFEFKKETITEYEVFFFEDIDYLDYPNSEFVLVHEETNIEQFFTEKIKDKAHFQEINKRDKSYSLRLKKAKFLPETYNLDLFRYFHVFYISPKLKKAFEEANITGCYLSVREAFTII